jgi:hypothetical protein
MLRQLNIYHVLTILLVNLSLPVLAQYDGMKGNSIYKKYDKSYINPDTRGKHAASLGGMATITSPVSDVAIGWGAHVGYNYLIIKKRKRFFGIKESFRDEPRAGFGAHFTLVQGGQFYLMANYFDPFFSIRGKLFSWYLFNEYGVGVHRYTDMETNQKVNALNLSLEVLRLRFGKSPLYLHVTTNYAAKNDFLSKKRLDVGAVAGLRLYIFKNK